VGATNEPLPARKSLTALLVVRQRARWGRHWPSVERSPGRRTAV